MYKVKNLTPFLAMLFSIAAVKGQDNLIIHLVPDSSVTVAIGDIQRITFNGENMLLKTVNGNESSYLLDDIACITFLDVPDEPNVIRDVTENIPVKIFINEQGIITVESASEIRMLTVFDIAGKTITSTNRNNIDVSFLSTGTYLLRVETTQNTVTKKFIKK